MSRRYTPDDDAIIHRWAGKKSAKEIGAMLSPSRTESSVYGRAHAIGAKFRIPGNWQEWSADELHYLKAQAALCQTAAQIAQGLPKRTASAVSSEAKRQHISLAGKTPVTFTPTDRLWARIPTHQMGAVAGALNDLAVEFNLETKGEVIVEAILYAARAAAAAADARFERF